MNKLLNKELADNIGISEVLLSYVLNRKKRQKKCKNRYFSIK